MLGSVAVIALLVPSSGARAQDMPLSQIIAEHESWTVVKGGYSKITSLFTDLNGRVRVNHDKGLDFVHLDGSVHPRQDADNDVKVPAQARTHYGLTYIIREDDPPTVSLLGRNSPIVETPAVARPAGLALSNDDATLFVGDAAGKNIWAFRVEKDGTLTAGERYCALRMKLSDKESGMTALTVDAAGRIYACTPFGVQIFDPTGRLCGVLTKPDQGPLTALAFGGTDRNVLYIACGDKLYARQMQARGKPLEH
jgi:hypothetical protein